VSLSTAVSLVDAVFTVLKLLIIARVLLTWLPVSPWNPVARWLRRIVDPMLRPFRRILPSFSGIDFSPLLALVVLFVLNQVVDSLLIGGSVSAGSAVLSVLRQVTLSIVVVFCIVLFVRLLFSFFHADPWHPLVMGMRRITDPLVRPFAGLVPRTVAVDGAAAVAFLVFLALYFAGRAFFNAVGAY
jgi:YggT family protein